MEVLGLEGTRGVGILLHSRSTHVLFRPVSKRLCVLDVKLGSKTKIVIAGDWNACVSQAQDDDDDQLVRSVKLWTEMSRELKLSNGAPCMA